ncbi:MAG TPA: methyltransferase domain-containing protein [Rhizomicrobium sp.]
MTKGNAQQIEFWNGTVGQRWARLQDRIDLQLNNITDGLMPFADVRSGERVLDIGCGCGTTTLRLGMMVAPEGAVAGLDISAPMLEVARARAQAMNADIAFQEADASSHDFQPVFDVVFSRFGVMFFDDPVAAFANIRRALAPKGRLAFVCWRPFKENAWAFTPYTAAKPLLPEQPPGDPHAPGPFAFADAARLKGILTDAGFANIRIEKLDTKASLGVSLDEAADSALNVGPLSRAALDLDDATRGKIRDAVKAAFEKDLTSAGVAPAAACWLVGATL